MPKQQSDKIMLEAMLFMGYVGVLAEEKERGQLFEINLILHCRQLKAVDTDLLVQTVDYAAVYQLVADIMKTARFDLIERLAGYLAEQVLHRYRLVHGLEVTVRKPQAPIDGQFKAMGVSIYRERNL